MSSAVATGVASTVEVTAAVATGPTYKFHRSSTLRTTVAVIVPLEVAVKVEMEDCARDFKL